MDFSWSKRNEKKIQRKEYEKQVAKYGPGFVGAPVNIIMRLDADTINRLPAQTLDKLPVDGLKRLSVDTLAKLSPETLSKLPPEELSRLPPEILASLPPKALSRLTPGFISRLHPDKLGPVLPELEPGVLAALNPKAISKVHPQYLARISYDGLAELAKWAPGLFLSFQELSPDLVLQLPHFVLSKLPPEYFKNLPSDVLPNLPEDVTLNIPPDIRKLIPKEDRSDQSGHNEHPPRAVSSAESIWRPGSPAPGPPSPAPTYPLAISQDGIMPSRAKVAPPIPARRGAGGGPPLAYNNNNSAMPKRTGSQSGSRSRASSPNYRVQASWYFEDSAAPERRGSRAVGDGGDAMENMELALREPPVPPKPEALQRKEVADGFKERIMEQMKDDIAAKEVMIDKLTREVEEKERLNQRMNAEKDLLNAQTDKLTAQVMELKVSQRASADRIFDCLTRMDPEVPWDRTIEDAALVATNYIESLKSMQIRATEDYNSVLADQEQLRTEKQNNSYLQGELDSAYRECRRLNDEMRTLQYDLDQRNRDLQNADANANTLKMTEVVLLKQVKELNERIERERHNAKVNLDNQVIHFEAQTKGIKQQNAELLRNLSEQRDKYGQEFKKQHDHYEGIRKNLESQIESLRKSTAEEVQQVRKQWEEDKKTSKDSFDEQLQKMRARFEEQIKIQRQAHEAALKNNSVHLQEKIKSLESDLVDNSDDFRPATDDSLKTSYGKLKLMVETITETFNLGVVSLPKDGHLDPNNFVGREGKGQMRVLLRSIVWARIVNGFFSSPFGFGSFGPGNGKTLLVELYSAWRRLFDDGSMSVSGSYTSDETFELFHTDKEANKWRSATFQSIMMAVNPKGAKKAQAMENGEELVRPFAENRQKVHDEILDVLNQVCNDPVQPEIAEKVVEIVKLAGELSLEFGSQRAQLALDVPRVGDSITIGPEFVDCEDGESARGKLEEVELLVLPKLFRVGDGRNDLKTCKIIVPGEIYPRRS